MKPARLTRRGIGRRSYRAGSVSRAQRTVRRRWQAQCSTVATWTPHDADNTNVTVTTQSTTRSRCSVTQNNSSSDTHTYQLDSPSSSRRHSSSLRDTQTPCSTCSPPDTRIPQSTHPNKRLSSAQERCRKCPLDITSVNHTQYHVAYTIRQTHTTAASAVGNASRAHLDTKLAIGARRTQLLPCSDVRTVSGAASGVVAGAHIQRRSHATWTVHTRRQWITRIATTRKLLVGRRPGWTVVARVAVAIARWTTEPVRAPKSPCNQPRSTADTPTFANAQLVSPQRKPLSPTPPNVAVVTQTHRAHQPAGHGDTVPFTQYDPDGHGSVAFIVVLDTPMVYSPGSAGIGAPLPLGQYTLTEPHIATVGDVELLPQ